MGDSAGKPPTRYDETLPPLPLDVTEPWWLRCCCSWYAELVVFGLWLACVMLLLLTAAAAGSALLDVRVATVGGC